MGVARGSGERRPLRKRCQVHRSYRPRWAAGCFDEAATSSSASLREGRGAERTGPLAHLLDEVYHPLSVLLFTPRLSDSRKPRLVSPQADRFFQPHDLHRVTRWG